MLEMIAFLFLNLQEVDLSVLKTTAANVNRMTAAEEAHHGTASKNLLELVTLLERQLRDFVEPRFPPASSSDTDCQRISAALNSQLQTAGVLSSDPDGYKSTIKISRPQGYSQAVLLQIEIKIPYGEDGVAYLYEWRRGRWSRSLVSERTQNKIGNFLSEIAFSPPDKDGNHLVVTVRTPIVSVSCIHGIGYQLYRVGPKIGHPRLLLELNQGVDICEDFNLRIEPDGFLIEMVGFDIFPGMRRTNVYHYKTIGDRVQRVFPVALQPQDFVHEWLQCNWKDASGWTASEARDNLKKWHERFRDHNGYVSGGYKFVQRCQDILLWQVAVEFMDKQGGFMTAQGSPFFLVRENSQLKFEMMDISESRQPGCPGESPPNEKRPTLFGGRSK